MNIFKNNKKFNTATLYAMCVEEGKSPIFGDDILLLCELDKNNYEYRRFTKDMLN